MGQMVLRPLAVLVAVAALALAGCGGGKKGSDASGQVSDPPAAATLPDTARAKQPACKAFGQQDVRALLRRHDLRVPARFEIENDQTDEISDCRYFARGVSVFLTIDRADQAQKRYWYRIEEQQEFHAPDASRRPSLVRGVGQDQTYGGAGAFWTPALNRLIAYRDNTMLLIGVTVRGASQTTARSAAVDVAKDTYRKLFGDRPPGKPYRMSRRGPHP